MTWAQDLVAEWKRKASDDHTLYSQYCVERALLPPRGAKEALAFEDEAVELACHNVLKAQKKEQSWQERHTDRIDDEATHPSTLNEDLETRENEEHLLGLVHRESFTDLERDTVLRKIGGLTDQQIAVYQGRSVDAVKRTRSDIRKKLSG